MFLKTKQKNGTYLLLDDTLLNDRLDKLYAYIKKFL